MGGTKRLTERRSLLAGRPAADIIANEKYWLYITVSQYFSQIPKPSEKNESSLPYIRTVNICKYTRL